MIHVLLITTTYAYAGQEHDNDPGLEGKQVPPFEEHLACRSTGFKSAGLFFSAYIRRYATVAAGPELS
jgi:hypothetical protein